MRQDRLERHASQGPWGDAARHLSTEELEKGLALLEAPTGKGRLELIVSRGDEGVRRAPERVRLTPEAGVPGDAWQRKVPDRPEVQITIMRADVGRLIANGQPLTLFGDNLLTDLDLSDAALPPGSRLAIGAAELEVTSEPHDGCLKYSRRFGLDALRLTAQHRSLHLRGIYARVVRAGEVAVGDAIERLQDSSER